MMFTIAGGAQANIEIGSKIKAKPEFLPPEFNGVQLVVQKIEETDGKWYPYVLFYAEVSGFNEAGDAVTSVMINEVSAISPEIITEVQ